MDKCFPVSRRRFLMAAGAGAVSMATMPFMQSAQAEDGLAGLALSTKYPENQSSFTVPDPSRIKLLQFTDIHFGTPVNKDAEKTDQRTMELMKRVTGHAAPDILVITGDMWSNNPDGKGKLMQDFTIEKISSLGLPTVYLWGNHDRLTDYAEGHDKFAEAPHSLYRGGTGEGNYTVELADRSGTRIWELLCLNSNGIGIQPEQWKWLEETKARKTAAGEKPVPVHCFMHIPILQYYYIWEGGLASGFKFEDVCSQNENGASLWKIKEYGPVKAIFCGHDHVNDYTGMAEGIELVYGRATGFGGYGVDVVRKGGKLITINGQAGTYVWESVFADGVKWVPEKDKQLDKPVDAPWMRWKED